MAWTSSTAAIGYGFNGIISTYSNNSQINGDWSNDYLEVYGANDIILANGGSDTVGAMLYPQLGMNGNSAYIDGGEGNDLLVATPVQGEQYATLVGNAGTDTFVIGANSDSTLNVLVADWNIRNETLAIFYENYRDGKFNSYSTDKGLLVYDDEGRLNVMLSGVYDVSYVLNDVDIWLYPWGIRPNSVNEAVSSISYYGDDEDFDDLVTYRGYLSGVSVNGNTLSVNNYHAGNVDLRGAGNDNIVVLDNTPSTDARILIGNNQTNYIYAGSGGDSLWGGVNNDALIGGAGNDNFFYGAGEGVDLITNSNWLDTVTLHNLTLNNFGVYADSNKVILACDANNSVTIQYNAVYSPLIKLADGSQYRYNGQNGSWQTW